MNVRRLLQFRLATLLVAVAVICALLVANTRPGGDTFLGHVSTAGGGLWISGNEYGWPWTYRVKSDDFLPELVQIVFDEFHRSALAANVAVGLLLVAAVMASAELGLRAITRWRAANRRNLRGDSQ